MLFPGFPHDSGVKNLPALQKTQIQSLSQENFLEKQMATHSSILAWEIPWTEELGGLQSTESQKSWTQLMQLSSSSSSFLQGDCNQEE